MGDQGQEERVYMQTCRKYVRVRIYICIYIRDKMWYMAHNTDVNGKRILCLRRSRRRRLKDRGVFISMYSGSAHPWPPVGNVDFFSETLGEWQRGPGCSGQAAAMCGVFPRVPPQKDLFEFIAYRFYLQERFLSLGVFSTFKFPVLSWTEQNVLDLEG